MAHGKRGGGKGVQNFLQSHASTAEDRVPVTCVTDERPKQGPGGAVKSWEQQRDGVRCSFPDHLGAQGGGCSEEAGRARPLLRIKQPVSYLL